MEKISGIVSRIGLIVYGGDQTQVTHALKLTNSDKRFILAIRQTNIDYRSILEDLALTIPGDEIEFTGRLNEYGAWIIDEFKNSSNS